MVIGQPLLQGSGQQQLLVRIVGKVGLAHRRLNWFDARPIIPATSQQPFFSDTLLDFGTRSYLSDSHPKCCSCPEPSGRLPL